MLNLAGRTGYWQDAFQPLEIVITMYMTIGEILSIDVELKVIEIRRVSIILMECIYGSYVIRGERW
jgi:hypothetical protein